jgi:hypothetical protein
MTYKEEFQACKDTYFMSFLMFGGQAVMAVIDPIEPLTGVAPEWYILNNAKLAAATADLEDFYHQCCDKFYEMSGEASLRGV